jgi:hypothetical protein
LDRILFRDTALAVPGRQSRFFFNEARIRHSFVIDVVNQRGKGARKGCEGIASNAVGMIVQGG